MLRDSGSNFLSCSIAPLKGRPQCRHLLSLPSFVRCGSGHPGEELFRDFPSDVGQQSDPQSDRPAGAACWPPSPLLEFGLGAGAAAAAPDSLVWSAASGERSEVRGLRQQPAATALTLGRRLLSLAQQAALKDQEKRGGVNLIGTHFPRARARAEPSDAFRQQTDPLEPAGR